MLGSKVLYMSIGVSLKKGAFCQLDMSTNISLKFVIEADVHECLRYEYMYP